MVAEFNLKKKDLWPLVYWTPSTIFLRGSEQRQHMIQKKKKKDVVLYTVSHSCSAPGII